MNIPSKRKILSNVFAVEFENDPLLKAEIIAPNHGPFPRRGTGFLYRDGKVCGNISADLPACIFDEPKGRGAPSKKLRDIAIYCCAFYFKYKNTETVGDIKSRAMAVDFWISKGYKGFRNEKHIRDKIEAIEDVISDARVRIVKFFDDGEAVVFIFNKNSKWTISNGVAHVSGYGFMWTTGSEIARPGEYEYKFEWGCNPEIDVFGVELQAAIDGGIMKDFVMRA